MSSLSAKDKEYMAAWVEREKTKKAKEAIKIDSEELIERAQNNYQRWCRENKFTYQRPQADASIKDTLIILRNSNGVLAEYEVIWNQGLIRLKKKVAKASR